MTIDQIDEHENTNGVIVHVSNYNAIGEGDAESAITPGAVVVKGQSDGDLIEAAAASTTALGVAGDNPNPSESVDTAAGLRTDYATGDRVRYYRGGVRFMGILADGESVTKGDKLKTAAAGELDAFVDGTDAAEQVVARYIGEADVTASGSTYILCEWGGV